MYLMQLLAQERKKWMFVKGEEALKKFFEFW